METSKKVLNNLGKELKNDLGSISKLSKLFQKTYTNVNSWKSICKNCGFENMEEAKQLYNLARDYKTFEAIMKVYPMQLDGVYVLKKRLYSTDANNVTTYSCANEPKAEDIVTGVVLKNNGFRLKKVGKVESSYKVYNEPVKGYSTPNNQGGKDVYIFVKRKDKPYTINDAVNALIEYAKCGFPEINVLQEMITSREKVLEVQNAGE